MHLILQDWYEVISQLITLGDHYARALLLNYPCIKAFCKSFLNLSSNCPFFIHQASLESIRDSLAEELVKLTAEVRSPPRFVSG